MKVGLSMSSIESVGAERRQFTIHPAVIKTLINEQAGSLSKAFAELVMNAVDAGATSICITSDPKEGTFQISDDGRGFRSRDEIERFFESFGTPHVEGDAIYGRFRIGRGQVMSYAKTVWRSGRFEMHVDLENEDTFGYHLMEHEVSHPGCTISGTIYPGKKHLIDAEILAGIVECNYRYLGDYDSSFKEMIRFVPIPITVNGIESNELPATGKWNIEDEFAWYKFSREEQVLSIYNQGVFVCAIPARKFGAGGVVTTKKPLRINLARNSIIEHQCDTWQHIRQVMAERFELQMGRLKKLTDTEAATLLKDLIFTDRVFSNQTIGSLCKAKFIPDVFGEVKAPNDFLRGQRYTLFDGVHMAIAEQVQNSGMATVVMPLLLQRAKAEVTEKNTVAVIARLRERLGWSRDISFHPFDDYVRELSSTSNLLSDDDLDPEERLVLNELRDINRSVAMLVMSNGGRARRLVAGVSDCMEGWTDGASYIAIHRRLLKGVRGVNTRRRSLRQGAIREKDRSGSPAKLVNLLIHEYAHDDSSLGDHHHSREFYVRYHEATMHREYGKTIDQLFRGYIAGISKLQIVPSGEHSAHLKVLAGHVDKLAKKGGAKVEAK